MEAFEVYLNSAKDDLPLFHTTMSYSDVDMQLCKIKEDDNRIANVAVGDLRLEVPKTKKSVLNIAQFLDSLQITQ